MIEAGRGDGGGGEQPRVAVLGLGNVLMGDDALGPYAIETLRNLTARRLAFEEERRERQKTLDQPVKGA